MEPAPARLHVLLASASPMAVVIRRGPSRRVCTVGWDRRDDSFVLGQWLKGRIYERRSDLSPDGRHLVYFAMNGKWHTPSKGSWSAVSRAPFLKALGFFPKGDCWHGGGLFQSARRVWLNDGYGHDTASRPAGMEITTICPFPGGFGGECLGVYFPRLLRDGWTRAGEEGRSRWLFDKAAPAGWTLRKIAHATIDPPRGKGCYYDTHQLVRGDRVFDHPGWEWADVDDNRVVWAERGVLWASRLGKDGIAGPVALRDFNDMRFEAIAAPY